MKTTFPIKHLVLAATVLASAFATAQSVTTSTSTTTAGTVSEFSPDTIIVRSEASPSPVRYHYSKTTTYVDEAGNPVSIETVKSGLPVTVYYSGAGDQLVADRVVVRRAAAASAHVEERSVNTVGTITELGPDAITIMGQAGTPVRYYSSSTTAYVDEDGHPVSVETVKSGLPVTVYYNREGDRMVASRVVVTQRGVPVNPGTVVEKKTTTTTTTTRGRVSNEKN